MAVYNSFVMHYYRCIIPEVVFFVMPAVYYVGWLGFNGTFNTT